MATKDIKVEVFSVEVEVTGIDGKVYDGKVALGADSFRARAALGEALAIEMAKNAAVEVAMRHAVSMGTEVDTEVDPRFIRHGFETLEATVETNEG